MTDLINNLISVIIPYNKDRGYLDVCLRSIRDQTYRNFEIIEAHSPGRQGQNFNAGLKKAKGEFIKSVHDDDWLPADALQSLLDGIGDAPWIVANAMQMSKDPWLYKPPYFDFKSQLMRYNLHGGTTMYRRDVLESIGGMDEALETGEEYDMHLKLLSLGHNPAYVDKCVYNYRMWSGSKSVIYRKDRTKWRKAELAKIKARYEKI